MASPAVVARLHGGLCTTAQLVAGGTTAGGIREAVGDGSLRRIRRGFYAVDDAPSLGVAAVCAGGRLAGLSASSTFGLWGGWGTPLHLSVPGNASNIRGETAGRGIRFIDGRRVVMHWNDDRRDSTWCWRVSAGRAIRQVLRWHDLETALAVVDTALTSGLLTPIDLAGVADGSTFALRRPLLQCRPGAQSGVESLARQRLERIGLTLRLQPEVPGVGRVDIGIVGTRVYVEVDGYEFHKSPEQFAEDRRRDAEGRSRGYTPMRFTAVQVRDDWPWVERMILQALARSGRVPS